MRTKSIRIMTLFEFPDGSIRRFWDGSGPCMDTNGEIWIGAVINDGLDQIETAINGEASTLTLTLSGIDPEVSDIAFYEMEEGNVIAGKFKLLIQNCDQWDQPIGSPKVKFTGTINNLIIDDSVVGDQVISSVIVEVTNRFDLRSVVNGAVLSDVDQKARSAVMNPGAPPDRIAERISVLADKTIVWPRYT